MVDMPAPLHDPRDVGEWIMRRLGGRFVDGTILGHMVWLCDGWHTAIEGQRLCDARAIAMDTGPNYAEIIDDGHPRGVANHLGIPHRNPARMTTRQTEIAERVLARYGGLTRVEIGKAVRSGAGVWMRTLLSGRGRDVEITSEAMLAEFGALAEAGRRSADARTGTTLETTTN